MAVTTETNQTSNEVQRLSPHLVVESSERAIEFYQKAFGAKEEIRLADDAGRIIHACVSLGDFHIMLVDRMPEHGMHSPGALGGSPVTIHLMVRDVDAFVSRAVDAGAKLVMPVADMFWGDRYGLIEDPFGHSWSVATHVRDLSPAEIKAAMDQAMPNRCGDC